MAVSKEMATAALDEVIDAILDRFWTKRQEERNANSSRERERERERERDMNDDDWVKIRQEMHAVGPDYSAEPVCAQELSNLARVYETLRGTDNRSRMLQLFCECAMKQ